MNFSNMINLSSYKLTILIIFLIINVSLSLKDLQVQNYDHVSKKMSAGSDSSSYYAPSQVHNIKSDKTLVEEPYSGRRHLFQKLQFEIHRSSPAGPDPRHHGAPGKMQNMNVDSNSIAEPDLDRKHLLQGLDMNK